MKNNIGQYDLLRFKTMITEIDKYAAIDSLIHRWDIRVKIITFIMISFIFSAYRSLFTVIAGFFLIILISMLSKIPLKFILSKARVPMYFLIPMMLMLIVSSGGDVLVSAGIVKVYKEGVLLSSVIFIKSVSIIILFNIMIHSARFVDTACSLKNLKLSDNLVNIILFSYRYIYLFFQDLQKMRTALKLRGFKSRNSMVSLKTSAYLVGSLLIRSYEHTEKIYNAMVLRGYNGAVVSNRVFRLKFRDFLLALAVTAIPAILVYADMNKIMIFGKLRTW